MLAMLRRLLTLFLILSIRCSAQTPEINSSDFEIPGGSIFGAALSNSGTVMYAQQYLWDDSGGATRTHVVRISSWDVQKKVSLANKVFPEPERSQTFPCRKMLLGLSSGHLYVCSGRTSIRVLDAERLETIKTIRYPEPGAIHDFVVDEPRDRVYLLADHVNGAITLDEFVLSTGERTRNVALAESTLAYSPLAYRPGNGLLTIAFTRTGGFGQKTDLVFYDASTLGMVKKIADLPRLDGLLFAGSTLIAAPGYAGSKKTDCLLSFDLQTFQSNREFCAPKTGVDFSVALVGKTYLVAATGVNRPKLFSDTIESISSSLSIWNLETKKLLTTLNLPDGYTAALAGVTIVGNAGGCIIVYQSSGVSPIVFSACIPVQPEDLNRKPLSSTRPK
jgi:hypothetical protein